MNQAAAPLAILAAYLIGSIPTAYLIVRAIKGIDVRTVGSGNVGATNAGRVLGSRGFLAVFGLDLLKGLLPTLALPEAARLWGGPQTPWLPVVVAAGTILGHNYPIYLQFQGGKGVPRPRPQQRAATGGWEPPRKPRVEAA